MENNMKRLEFDLLQGGYCKGPEFMLFPESSNGSIFDFKWKELDLPSLFGVVRHPIHGVVLIDTGYDREEYDRVTLNSGLPGHVYRWLIPVHATPNDSACHQLEERMKIKPEEVSYVIITHFHADHICGLSKFPYAKYVVLQTALDHLKSMSSFHARRHGFFPGFLPADFDQRVITLRDNDESVVDISSRFSPFVKAWDLFKDDSILIVSLPGHCIGHSGVIIPSFGGNNLSVFMVGDACWHSDSLANREFPHWLTFKFVHVNGNAYKDTLIKLADMENELGKSMVIIPAHCPRALQKLKNALEKASSNEEKEE